MIISHHHGFVVVFPPKVGSSSAHAAIVESGILDPSIDEWYGYRNAVTDTLTPCRNMRAVTAADVRRVSPHAIPANIGVPLEDETIPLVRHIAPTEMLRLGLVTQSMIHNYVWVSFTRDPVDRYVSAWVFGQHLAGLIPERDRLLAKLQRLDPLPYPFLGRTLRDYVMCEGRRIPHVRVIDQGALDEGLAEFLAQYGASAPVTVPRFKGDYRPDELRAPFDWIPPHLLAKLEMLMADDIAFHEAERAR